MKDTNKETNIETNIDMNGDTNTDTNENINKNMKSPDINNILSPEEIQALSGAVTEGIIETREQTNSVPDQVTTEFDLTDKKTLPSKMIGLDIINNRFIRKFRASLSATLRKVVEIDVISNIHLSFARVSSSIPIPSCINLLQFDPLPGSPFIAFDTNLSMTLLDVLCGGKGQLLKDAKKEEFAAIEQHLMAKVAKQTIECLEDIWKIIFPIKISAGDMEFDSRYITTVSHDEMFIVTHFSVKIEGSNGSLTLALPYTTLEPIKQKLTSSVISQDEQKINYSWMNSLEKFVNQIDANITVEIGKKTVAVHDLVKMKVGDIIILNQFIGNELDVYVEGCLKFKGYAGHYKGNNALKITSLPFPSIKGEKNNA